MKKEELFEVLEDIDENKIKEARQYTGKKRSTVWITWAAVAAGVVIIAAVAIPLLGQRNAKNATATAEYEEAVEMEENEMAAAVAEDADEAGEIVTEESCYSEAPDEAEDKSMDGEPAEAEPEDAEPLPAGEEAAPEDVPAIETTELSDGLFLTAAAYPPAVAEGMSAQEFMENDVRWEWLEGYREKADASGQYQDGLSAYYHDIMEKVLVSEDDNTVCSPINTFIAFAMLAEVSDGNTRQQILDMLNVPDIETLRDEVSALWKSNYVDTPTLKSLLADSLWLRNATNYNEETLERLAALYYASTFRGQPGSAEMDDALRKWTDDNTGGLLGEYTKDLSLSPDTVLAIVSTIYYKAGWVDVFYPEYNTQETFHGTKGDTTVDMMHHSDTMGVYRTDDYTAVSLSLTDSGSMTLYLPENGTDVNALAADPDILGAATWSDDEHWSCPMVNLSVPKFRVSGKTDLLSVIAELGITDALDPNLADFTPLTDEVDGIFLGSAEHAAMVEIDENGVTGAAYTELALTEGAMLPDETLDIVFDRPFLFVVTGNDGSVLFSGVVRNIE